MDSRFLHVVAFNVPHPPDYGGIIDIFYKLKALKEKGILCILHCYQYGRQTSKELKDLCYQVNYYPRNSGLKYILRKDPYIVSTRNANSMPEFLLKDEYPVLFEGLHSTALLPLCKDSGKTTAVRAHNIEHHYYQLLSRSTRQPFQKVFLKTEARKLMSYEKVLNYADFILGISESETEYFNNTYGNAIHIPAFHRYERIVIRPGKGSYILLHGNLGVPENSEKILILASRVLSDLEHQVIVSGKNPSASFQKKLKAHGNIQVVANPEDEELENLIAEAQINLLHTGQATGIKLKLLHALFAGRHCLVNSQMVEGSGLAGLCRVCDDHSKMKENIDELMQVPFTRKFISERTEPLTLYSNEVNARKIIDLLFP